MRDVSTGMLPLDVVDLSKQVGQVVSNIMKLTAGVSVNTMRRSLS